MKKFTLLSLAISSILLANAGAPKSIKVQRTLNTGTPIEATRVMSSKNPKLEATRMELHSNSPIMLNAASENTTNNTIDEGQSSNIYPNYFYPTGTLFPIMWVYQEQNGQMVGPLYATMGNWFLPACSEVVFPNMSYEIDGTSIFLAQNPESTWAYQYGIINQNYFVGSFQDVVEDLAVALGPHPLINMGFEAPTLTVNGTDFVIGTTQTNGTTTTTSPDFIVAGGDGKLNPGLQTNFITINKVSDNIEYGSLVANYNRADDPATFNEVFGTGDKEGAIYTNYSATAVREMHFGSAELAEYGLKTDDFFGFGQAFETGNEGGYLYRIAIPAYMSAEDGAEATFTLYRIDTKGSGENEYQEWVEVTSGIYTYEKSSRTLQIAGIDIYDEENDKDYIHLDPNSLYIVVISDLGSFDGFIPTMPEFTLDKTDAQSVMSADANNRGQAYLIYVNEDGIAPVSADYNWSTDNPNNALYYPALNLMLTIKYPYITPVARFIEMVTYYPIRDASINSVDLEFFNMGEGSTLDAARAIVFSDMKADDLLKSIEYSTPELKDKLKIMIVDDEDFSDGTVNYESAQRDILIVALDDIPANSWIKLHNFNATVTFNLPAHDTSAIGSVVADGEAVATELYDLQGRKLSGDAQGIVVKKMTMADGSVKTVKVVK